MKNKNDVLIKKIELKDKEIKDLKLLLKQKDYENQMLQNRVNYKENNISQHEMKLYELIAICEKKIGELDESITVLKKARKEYQDSIQKVKEINKQKVKEMNKFLKKIKQ